jgi:hypothetical protein
MPLFIAGGCVGCAGCVACAEEGKISSKYKLRGDKRIGPHDVIIYSIIFGSLLGNAQGEIRKGNGGTRISFYQEGSHLSYMF